MYLWSGSLSMFSAKVRMTIAEKGIDVEIRDRPWTRAMRWEPKPKAFLDVSPRGEVPVLVDGDLVLFDSTVINEYLEEKYPTPALMPRGSALRASCRMLEDQADWIMANHVTALIREVFMKPDPATRDAAAIDKSLTTYADYYAMLERGLAGGEYLCGAFSFADIATFMAAGFGHTLGAPIGASCPHLQAWYRRVYERPAVKGEFDGMMQAAAAA